MERRGVVITRVLAGVLFMVVAAASVGAAQDAAAARAMKNPVKPTAASLKNGQEIFTVACQPCHGPIGNGKGVMATKNPPPADLTDDKWDFGSTDGEIFDIIMNGAPKEKTVMKGQKGKLQDTEVWNLVNYVRELGKKQKARAERAKSE
jgi:mono/diheme cytochrome c family protein